MLNISKCVICGTEFIGGKPNQQYCSYECQCALNGGFFEKDTVVVEEPPVVVEEPPRKTFNDYAREAKECGIDYGTYRALSESGKSFEEIKERFKSCPLPGHSHLRKFAAGDKW